MRYPVEKLSDKDELEKGGLANLVGPRREQCPKDSEKGADGSTLERSTKKKKAKKTSPSDPPGEGKKKAVKCKRGQGDEPGSVTSEAPPEKKQKGERKKKRKRKVETDAAGPIPKKKKAKGTPSAALERAPDMQNHCWCQKCHQELPRWPWNRGQAWMSSWRPICLVHGPPKPQWPSKARPCVQFNGSLGPEHGRFLGQTQKIYPPGKSTTGIGGHSFSEVAQAVLGTSSHG